MQRKFSARNEDLRRQCEYFQGLKDPKEKWQLLNLVEDCSAEIGVSDFSVRLLRHYIGYTDDADWLAGSGPVVGIAVIETAEHFGVSTDKIQRAEKQLVAAGLIAWIDAPSLKRQAYRDATGLLNTRARGVGLAPLAFKRAELEVLRDEKREVIRKRRDLHRALFHLRSETLRLSAHEHLCPTAAQAGRAIAARLPERREVGACLKQLQNLRREAEEAYGLLLATLPQEEPTHRPAELQVAGCGTAGRNHTPSHTDLMTAEIAEVLRSPAAATLAAAYDLQSHGTPAQRLKRAAEEMAAYLGVDCRPFHKAAFEMGLPRALSALVTLERQSTRVELVNPTGYFLHLVRAHPSKGRRHGFGDQHRQGRQPAAQFARHVF